MSEIVACKECGGSPVNHHLIYLSVLLGLVIDPVNNTIERILPADSLYRAAPFFTRALAALGLGSMTDALSPDDNGRTRVLWEEADRRNIKMREFRLIKDNRGAFISSFNNDELFFEALPRPKGYDGRGQQWMDYKALMKKHFKKAEIPLARGNTAFTVRGALKIFNTISKPVITKPNFGTRSRHTTVHISDEKQFIEAFKRARQLSPVVMIEEELSGYVFRGTLINKKLVATLRREPAYVIGDGTHTVRELLAIENAKPLRAGPIFHQLHADDEAERELAHFGRTWETVPKNDEIVTLGQKTSRGVGGGITDVTESVHPENIALLEKVAEVVNDPVIGVDFIMDDVAKSWKDQPKSGIIECNSAPFIDLHHYPLVGQPRNVAGMLWDVIYPASAHHQ